jgi:hypothetical protein
LHTPSRRAVAGVGEHEGGGSNSRLPRSIAWPAESTIGEVLICGVHYLVEDQPEAVADLMELICIAAFEMSARTRDLDGLSAFSPR